MPDNENLLNTQELEDSVSIDNLTQSPDLDGDDVVVLVHENNGVKSTYKAILRSIANFINKLLHYSTDLHTQNDTIIGAINELADGGGGSADIISEASGSIATFNDGGDNIPVKSLVTEITATQAGTGTPAPTNVRSISGFDSIDLLVSSKNLWIYGDVSFTGYNKVVYLFRPLPPATYTISATVVSTDTDANTCIMIVYYTDGTNSATLPFNRGTRNSKTLNVSKTIARITFYSSDNYVHGNGDTATWSDIQIEKSSTMTDYEAPNIHTITLPETIYGGEVDVVGGNGSKTFGYVDLGDLTWNYAGGTFRAIVSDAISPISGGDTTAICEIYNRVGYSSSIADLSFYLCANQLSASKYLVIKDDSYNGDTNAFKTGVTGKKLIYTLGTPTTFNTTPESIPTLSGVNNIYSSTGDVEIEYFNENADQTSELIDAKQEFANYSYEEKIVGKWVDGSDLYEKTLYFNNVKLDKTDSTSELVHGIDNIGSTRFVAEVYFKFPNSGQDSWSPANNGLWNNGVYNFYWCVGETSIFILSTSGVYFDANPNRSYLVKIRYTKA